jgi:UDP-N-acetylmuramoyl-tripeptide--D-alanyl-D-alanine ligase
MLTLGHCIRGLGGATPEAAPYDQEPVAGVFIDSRQVKPGGIFVALLGEREDGHTYVRKAFEAGARLALIEHAVDAGAPELDLTAPAVVAAIPPAACIKVSHTLGALQQLAAYWRTVQSQVRVVGITGSVGKTSTKELVWSVLRRRFSTMRSEGNYNNEIGLPLTLLGIDEPCQRVVLEMGMYDLGEIRQLAEIARPAVGVITNVGPTHLERLKTIERVAQAKSELVQALPADGWAILNCDDPLVRAMAELTAARVFYYGLDAAANLWASDIESKGLEGIRLTLHFGRDAIHVRVPLLGRHSVHTVLRAAAVGLVEGLSWEEIVPGLQDMSASIRLVAADGPHGSTILDDTYNSSPASAIAALNLLDDLSGRRIAVLGDMLELGDETDAGHRKVGRRVVDVAAILITVGSLASIIAREALALGMPKENVLSVDTNAQAIEALNGLIRAGDVVLIKGSRGVKMEEIVSALGRPAWPTR